MQNSQLIQDAETKTKTFKYEATVTPSEDKTTVGQGRQSVVTSLSSLSN